MLPRSIRRYLPTWYLGPSPELTYSAALGVAVPEVAELPVSGIVTDVDVNLMIQRAAARVVNLGHDIFPRILVVGAVLGIRGEVVDNALLDTNELEERGDRVPQAAETKCLDRAVLLKA